VLLNRTEISGHMARVKALSDPTGMGAMFFAVVAVVAQLDRNYVREKTRMKQYSGMILTSQEGPHVLASSARNSAALREASSASSMSVGPHQVVVAIFRAGR
jgi:hypothetical protein